MEKRVEVLEGKDVRNDKEEKELEQKREEKNLLRADLTALRNKEARLDERLYLLLDWRAAGFAVQDDC